MNKAVIFILVCHSSSSIGDSKFDFGLFENELFLKTVSQEDRKLTSTLKNLSRKYQDETLNKFLQKTARVSEKLDFIQHPINAYQIIKKYAIVYPSMVDKLSSLDLKEKIKAQMNGTERIQHISEEDFRRSVNALVQIIFSFGLDMDAFSTGVIPANLHGTGDTDLVSGQPLMADDLFNIAVQAGYYFASSMK